jgi:plastocyanin
LLAFCDFVIRLVALLAIGLLAPAPAPPVIDLAGTARLGGHPLADAVIWIDAPGVDGPPPAPAVMDQRNLTFSPHVLAVRVGTRVKLPNNDLVFHNVFSFYDGKKFNLGFYPVGMVKTVLFDKPGLSRIFCNIHPQMAAYVLAVDTPFYAVTDAHGHFVIHGLPPGTYTYHAWRAGGPLIDSTLTAAPADTPVVVQWP